MAGVPPQRFRRFAVWVVVPTTVICIAAGAGAEATVFRLAKFDEIDFFNQSLGAILAGLVGMCLVRDTKPIDMELRLVIVTGALLLAVGAYFAVT